jgi:transposase
MKIRDLLERLDRIEILLLEIHQDRQTKEWYSTAEVAEKVGRAEFTVREWCRNGRVRAEKERHGRGRALEWRISHEELQRILNHGPLPLNQKRT